MKRASSEPYFSAVSVYLWTTSRTRWVAGAYRPLACHCAEQIPSPGVSLACYRCSDISAYRRFRSIYCAPPVDTSDSLQTVIISRFLINLRRTQQPPTPSRPSGIRTSRFRLGIPSIPDILGDMGQPLDHGVYERDVAAEGNVQEDAVAAGPSFVQGSSTSAAPATRAAQRGV